MYLLDCFEIPPQTNFKVDPQLVAYVIGQIAAEKIIEHYRL